MKYGVFGKFVAKDGMRDELVSILLQASEELKKNDNCYHYVVGISAEPNDVWVSEVWSDKAAHDSSLEPEETRALIQKAMPLIASMESQTETEICGGKGI